VEFKATTKLLLRAPKMKCKTEKDTALTEKRKNAKGKIGVEEWRIELQAFRMQSGRSTTELYPRGNLAYCQGED
jgi:hypothetical protein